MISSRQRTRPTPTVNRRHGHYHAPLAARLRYWDRRPKSRFIGAGTANRVWHGRRRIPTSTGERAYLSSLLRSIYQGFLTLLGR